MKLLLDTHVFLWSLEGDSRLSSEVQGLLVDRSNDVIISLVSLIEIVVKIRTGKLRLRFHDVNAAIDNQGFSRLPISTAHLAAVESLPMHHRDPFDHMLVAQAISEAMTLVTHDRRLMDYPVEILRC